MSARLLVSLACLASIGCTAKSDAAQDGAPNQAAAQDGAPKQSASSPAGGAGDELEGDTPPKGGDEPAEAAGPCRGLDKRLEPIWSSERREAMLADHGAAAPARLDAFAERWLDHAREACEATEVRGEASHRVRVLREDCLAEQRLQFQALVDILRGDDSARVWTSSVAALEHLPEPSSCLAEPAMVRPEPPEEAAAAKARLRGRGELAAARVWLELGAPVQARTLAQAVYDRAGEDPVLLIEARWLLGAAQAESGQVTAGIDNLQEAGWAAASAKHDEAAALASVALVRAVGLHAGNPEDALGWARHAEAALKRLAENPALQRRLKLSVARVHLLAGDGTAAEAALDAAGRLAAVPSVDAITTELLVAEALLLQHRQEAAEKRVDEAERAIEDLLGKDHASMGQVYVLRARLAEADRDFPETVKSLQTAHDLVHAGFGRHAPELIPIALHRAEVESKRGDTLAAVTVVDAALLVSEKASADWGDATVVDAQIARARLHRQAKELDPARELLDEAVETARDRGMTRRFVLASVALARACADLGDAECTDTALRRAAKDRSAPKAVAAIVQFELAKLTYADDPSRAHDMAQRAAKAWRDAGEPTKVMAVEAETWLSTHPKP